MFFCHLSVFCLKSFAGWGVLRLVGDEFFQFVDQAGEFDHARFAPQAMSVFEKDQRGDSLYLERFDGPGILRVVDVDLDDPDAVFEGVFQLGEDGVHHFARPAPRGIEVHQYGLRLIYDSIEIFTHGSGICLYSD